MRWSRPTSSSCPARHRPAPGLIPVCVSCMYAGHLPPERVEVLPAIAGRHLLWHSIIPWPAARRQMVGAEQPVEQREVDREILVDRFGFEAVVPVVKARSRDEAPDPVEIPADVG